MLSTLLENVDEKMLATLLNNIDEKKCWQHFQKMLTRKNIVNTYEKC
jgi:hypothetical protein